jgi:uracil-DNA glycosylase
VPRSTRPAARIRELAELAVTCTDCDLYRRATQVVFGAGPVPAPLMLLGEQPGDREDRVGEPFVGPAGGLLRRACAEAAIELERTYVTNAVKHFKWERSGKVRLHKTPNAGEVRACSQWWERELELVAPRVLCCLGATAAKAVLGPSFRITRDRGEFVRLADRDVEVVATFHPSAVLRARGGDRDEMFATFVADLSSVSRRVQDAVAG